MSQQRLRYKWQRVQTKSRLIYSGGHVFKFHPAPNFYLSLFGPNSLSRTNAQVYVGIHGTVSLFGARFAKVSNLFGHISGDLILFLSSKGRRLEVRNFAVILSFISIWKDQLDGISGWQFNEWLFRWAQKLSGFSRRQPQVFFVRLVWAWRSRNNVSC